MPEREKDNYLTKDEYLGMRNLENDRNVIITPEDKGSSIAVWDRLNYLAEPENQFIDSNTYKEVKEQKEQVKLVAKSNSMFEGLKKKRITTEKKKNYFKLNFEKPTNIGKLYLLPNIHKRLSNLLGHPVILSSATLTENVSEFLDHHLQPAMNKWDLGEKTKGAIVVTTDMVGIYPSISHIEGLEVLCKQYGKFLHKKVPTEDIKLAENVFLSLISSFSNKYVEPLFVLNLPFPI